MVRATIILSVVAALVATVSAVPSGSLVDVDGGEYIGLGDIYAQGALNDVVNANDLQAHDVLQGINVAGDDVSGSSAPMRGSGRINRGDVGGRINRGDVGGRASAGSSVSSGSGCGGGCSHGDHGLLDHLLKREAAPAKAMGKKKMAMRRKVAAAKN